MPKQVDEQQRKNRAAGLTPAWQESRIDLAAWNGGSHSASVENQQKISLWR
jgi:hypothetical protein